jgi:uncharacterized protein (TIGR03437 family)
VSAGYAARVFLGYALLAWSVCAAPKLRLTQTAFGPFSVAVGAAAPAQTVEAYNVGDGEIALDTRTSAPWLKATMLDARECEAGNGRCFPLRIEATAAGLEKGRHTGVITVLAPGALDAPQTITVTLDAGGSVPERIQFAMKPGGVEFANVRTGSPVRASVASDSGGAWLSIPTQSSGSFQFSTSTVLQARHLQGMANGDYAGRLVITGSTIGEENRTVPVTLKVTEGPICAVGVPRLDLRLAEGSAAYGQGIGVVNRGGGTLALEPPQGSAGWISGTVLDGNIGVLLKIDPSGLSPGFYRGELEIRSNADNGAQKLEVGLEITARGEPWLKPGSFSDQITSAELDSVAPGMLLALKGEQITLSGSAQAPGVPWPGELAGARLLVNGVPAALETVNEIEIRFQVPAGVEGEEAVFEIEREGVKGNALVMALRAAAPRLERVTFEDGTPISPERPAKAGDRLLLVATGLGRTDPPVAAGAVAEGARTVESVTVTFAAPGPFSPVTEAEAQATASPERPGRYIVLVTVPQGTTAGSIQARIAAAGLTSNGVNLLTQ